MGANEPDTMVRSFETLKGAGKLSQAQQLQYMEAIAGTYLANMLKEKAGFFVDEDRQRTSKTHMGLPVYAPEEVPSGEPIFLAFPTAQAAAIKQRLMSKYPSANLITPPPLAA